MISHVLGHKQKMLADFLAVHAASAYTSVNSRFLDGPLPQGYVPHWPIQVEPGVYELRVPAYPVVDTALNSMRGDRSLIWNGMPVQQLNYIYLPRGSDIYWSTEHELPTHITAFRDGEHPALLGVWATGGCAERRTDRFPESWRNIAGLLINPYTEARMEIWNNQHPTVRAATDSAWDWAKTLPLDSAWFQRVADIADDPARASAWILRTVTTEEWLHHWNGLAEREPALMKQIWRSVLGDNPSPVIFAVQSFELRLHVITATEWLMYLHPDDTVMAKYLPDPPLSWQVQFAT